MIHHMQEMARWHTENFNAGPIGDGYEIERHRVRLEGAKRYLLRQGRREGAPLAALACEGRRLGLPPRLGRRRVLVRLDWRRPPGRVVCRSTARALTYSFPRDDRHAIPVRDSRSVPRQNSGNTRSISTTRCTTPRATCSSRSSPAWRSSTTTRAAARPWTQSR